MAADGGEEAGRQQEPAVGSVLLLHSTSSARGLGWANGAVGRKWLPHSTLQTLLLAKAVEDLAQDVLTELHNDQRSAAQMRRCSGSAAPAATSDPIAANWPI